MYICQGVNCIPSKSYADPALQAMKKEGGRVKKEPLNAIEGKGNEHLKKSRKSKKISD